MTSVALQLSGVNQAKYYNPRLRRNVGRASPAPKPRTERREPSVWQAGIMVHERNNRPRITQQHFIGRDTLRRTSRKSSPSSAPHAIGRKPKRLHDFRLYHSRHYCPSTFALPPKVPSSVCLFSTAKIPTCEITVEGVKRWPSGKHDHEHGKKNGVAKFMQHGSL